MSPHVAPQIRLEGVDRRWGARVALRAVDLTVAPGERVALIGPSGSGKTTVLRLVMAALRASAGRVWIGDRAIDELTPAGIRAHRRRCALVDQGAQLIPQLSVHRNVLAGTLAAWPWWRTVASMAWPLERARVAALLDEVGLRDRQWDRADALSGGQRQRVAIARALMAEPRVMLADEPTAALDPTTAAEVIDLLVREARAVGATLIASSHRVSQLVDHVDRVIGLRDGRVTLDTPPSALTDAALDALYEGSRERA